MNLQCTETNVLFQWKQHRNLAAGSIALLKELSRDTRWAEAKVVGPQSILKVGDELLLSARPTAYVFEHHGETYMNTSDAATLCYKRKGKLGATKGTIIYEWVEQPEEKTESGIILIKNENNRLKEVREATVVAAGPEAGVKAGDTIILAYDKDAYKMENIIPGRILHNCGKEAVIAYF